MDDTELDCGTLGRAPVDVCRERVVDMTEFDDVVDVLLLTLSGGSNDVTVVEGAVWALLLLRKCLKENDEFWVGAVVG